ncbi:methionyl-tRNA formyltransferase [Candidatus Gottesmanbacteria bacterium]|nr:methionyl-tRNA formyltransferase [Candidatus Gottesmanbacteria bacterium]
MNLSFFSSSPLSLPLLEKLNTDFSVKLVITHPDRPVGREQFLTPSVFKTWAIKKNVPVLSPTTLKFPTSLILVNKMRDLNIDLAIVIDYGLLIPRTVFTAPTLQTINIHFSLLPKYRGPYPDAFVILKGDKKTGISFVLIDEGFDTGDILAQKEVAILSAETAGDLHQRLYQETENIITYIIDYWAKYNTGIKNTQSLITNHQLQLFLPPKKQDNKSATYTKKLIREDGFISWEKLIEASNSLYNFYRALTPWPGMWTSLAKNNKRLKILKAHLEKEKFAIDEVQLEGKKPVSWKQFYEAYKN